MSNTIDLTEALAAAVDQLDYPAIEEVTRGIADSELEPHTAEDLARFLRMLAMKIMRRRVQREYESLSGTRKEWAGSLGGVEAMTST